LSDTPAHQPANDLKVYMVDSCKKIYPQYQQLQDHIFNIANYTEINLDRFLPEDTM
jgi:hypothetical protein